MIAHLKGVLASTGLDGAVVDVGGVGYMFGWQDSHTLHVRAESVDFQPNPHLVPGVFVQGEYINGMSGGPVVDFYGNVVGIVQLGVRGTSYGVGVQVIKTFLLGIK